MGRNNDQRNLSRSGAYVSWDNMKRRCRENYKGYENVEVCERWLGKDGFRNFYDDMGERPEGMSIDRIESDGNYEPSNCRWATLKEQNDNRRIKFGKNMSNPVKLNEEKVIEIRRLHSQGVKQVELCKLYDVSSGMMSMIINRKLWNWI